MWFGTKTMFLAAKTDHESSSNERNDVRFQILGTSKSRLLTSTVIAGVVSLSAAPFSLLYAGPVTNSQSNTNDERYIASEYPFGNDGFTISIDGATVAGDIDLKKGKPSAGDIDPTTVGSIANGGPASDIDLGAVDVQVKFDGLEVEPILNVSTANTRRSFQAGEVVEFIATSNYPAWIERSEIIIFEKNRGETAKPLKTIPVDSLGYAAWGMPDSGDDGQYEYVLRVYDHRNRYDETKPLSVERTRKSFDKHDELSDDIVVSAGNGQDRTAVRNIPVYGGAVTIYGRNVPPGYRVTALGEDIPVDNDNSFVVQRILPPGEHDVGVEVEGAGDKALNFDRAINIPANDLFYVGLIDVTIGKRYGNSALVAAAPNDYKGVHTRGRAAFYLKGKIRGRYLLTAAADTGEAELDNLFTGFDSKNPRQLLRRIDPDKYYPVYGDDSTAKEDAPTSGKFYVKLEHGDSHVMWGNFKSGIDESTYLRSERTLYGAQARYRSEATTSFGERTAEAEIYAAQPGTLPQRDVLRGTGGSAYFLKQQDISIGSESVSIQVRGAASGRVIETIRLEAGKDYTIDYIQGVIILNKPIASSVAGNATVRDENLSGDNLNLIVQYEYTPTSGDIDGYSLGGRAQAWAGDKVRFGATGLREKTGTGALDADQEMLGVDVVARHSDTTYAKAEFAQTKGPGFGKSVSTDGGLTLTDVSSTGIANRISTAWNVEAQLDLADVSDLEGKIGAYAEKRQAGFATLNYNVGSDEELWGLYADIEVTKNFALNFVYDDYSNAKNVKRREGSLDATFELNRYWEVTIGAKYSDLNDPALAATKVGSRVDAGVQIAFKPDEDREFYAFAQGTVSKSASRLRNDRVGVGSRVKIGEKTGLETEVSYGSTGWGAIAGITYDPTANEHYYLGYKLEAERSKGGKALDGNDLGGIVVGARRKYNDEWAAFTENNYDMFGRRRELTTTYGVTYTPDKSWTVDGGLEVGQIDDPNASNIDRKAVSLGVSYRENDDFTARIRGELRFDDSQDNTRDVESILFTGGVAYKVSPNWRFVTHVDGLFSQSNQGAILDGDYIEGSLGFAYRPIDNDRLNALLKYTYLEDLPGADQVTVSGSTLGPRQRSHVFSADTTFKLNNYVSIGGKYGFRFGSAETTRGSNIYVNSNAQLGIIRADLHIVHNWDALIEGRALWSQSAKTVDFGAVAAVYRHFGKNAKAGIGYNFGRFSDDLTDLTLDDQGLFLNVIGKF